MSVDPMWEKYVGMSPYNYCAGNPVKFVDKKGEDVFLSFQNDEVREHFLVLVNNMLESSSNAIELLETYDTYIGLSYKVIFRNPQNESYTSNRSSRLYSELKSIVDDDAIARINVVSDDPEVTVGSFTSSTIDILDISEFDKTGDMGASSAATLIHELREQLEKGRLGLFPGEGNARQYYRCHGKAVVSENGVDRKNRIDLPGNDYTLFSEPNGKQTRQYIYENDENCFTVEKKTNE